MPKIPKDATPDIQRSLREVWQALDQLQRANITDLHGRRMSNAGNPKQRRDYTNKAYVDDALQQFRTEVQKDIRRLSKLRTQMGTTLPPPGSTDFSFGYWYVDNLSAPPGQSENEVKGYTNTAFVFDRDGGTSEVPPADRIANLTAIIDRLATAGFQIWLDVGPNDFLQPADMIEAAKDNWSKVKYVLCGDEPDFAPVEEFNTLIALVKNLILDNGLAMKPIGVTVGAEYLVTDIWDANWDFVNIEAYTIPCDDSGCGAPTAEEEIAAVKGRIDQMKARIAGTKFLNIVMQGYDRNGAFEDIEILAALNAATYFQMAKGDTRVRGINIFAYNREGGSRDHPELKSEHQKIWADLTGGTSSSGAKKCIGDPRNCEGAPTCCDGGLSNPCCCPRLCEFGSYMAPISAAETQMIVAHPELFVPGTQKFIGIPEALLFRGYVTVEVNTSNPTLEAVDDPDDGKQVLVRLRVNPEFREDYAVWATDLTPRFPPGAYRATCWPGEFGAVDC